jgi:hypothetical protein
MKEHEANEIIQRTNELVNYVEKLVANVDVSKKAAHGDYIPLAK